MELEFASVDGIYEESLYEIEGDTDDAGLENERCGICMDDIIDRGVLDCCEHWFCFACIDNWATITNLCPLCQNEFQLITCVPVYDTIGSGKVEDDSVSRDDDWSIQGTNNTLSFPSYYIDENAVICLDGNGCKIRNGAATSGDDSVLDTSIACDSCDIWYHAFCVDFDPESTSENSWLCPRCVDDVPQKFGVLSLQMQEEYVSERDSCEPSAEASHSGKVSVSVADAGETAVVVSMIEGNNWIKEPKENCLSAQDSDNSKQTLDEKHNTQSHVHAEEKSLALSLSQDIHFDVPCDSLHLIDDGKSLIDEAVSELNGYDRCELFSGLLSDKLNNKGEPSIMESNVDLHLGLSVSSSLSADKWSDGATQNLKSEVSQSHNLSKDFSLSVGNMLLDADEDVEEPCFLKGKSMISSDTGHTEVHDVCTRDEMLVDPPAKRAKVDGESLETSQKDESEKSITGSSQECSHLLASSKYGSENIYAKDAMATTVPGHTEVHNVCSMDEMASDSPGKKSKRDGKFLQTSLKDGGRKSISGGSKKYSHLPANSEYEADNTCTKDEMVTTVPGHTEVHNICTRDKRASYSPAMKAKDDRNFQQSSLKDVGRKPISGSDRECSQLTAGSKHEADKIYTKDKMATKVLVKKAKAYVKSQQSHLKPEVKNVILDGMRECAHTGSKDDVSLDVPEQKYNTPDITSIICGTNQRHARMSRSNSAHKMESDNGTGLRVKKIMRRGVEDESSKLVENLRKEIREAVHSKATNDLSQSNVFDPKLLLAFRNAIARPKPEHAPVKKLNPAFVRAKKSLLQKGKIRENLTKKIYGNSNGRRKRAWDRDWEVEFWKHRCKRVTRSEKVETLMSVLDLLKNNAKSSDTENDAGDKAASPILSRLYLADASVFPRTDDIKPFSALTGTGPDEVNRENNMKKNVRFPLQISKNSSEYVKNETSCKKLPSNGSVNKQNNACTTSGSKTNDKSLKETPAMSDVKIDKRKWALEVLARKTSTVQKNATEGNDENHTTLKANFPLLAQLPRDMRPELAPSRHNKVPISVRQAQLYRLTEHFLRKAELPVIRRTADTELAVADAVNIEKEVVNRSNSKLVYINLCSQALSQHMNTNRPDMDINKPDGAVETESSQSVVQTENIDPAPSIPSDLSPEAALRMAGLCDTPPSSPCRTAEDNNDTSINVDNEPDNVFDMDTHAELDIYGDFEYDLENDDYIGGVVPNASKPQTEDGDSKMKVVFSTLSIPRTDDAMNPKDDESLEINVPKDPSCEEASKDGGDSTLDIRIESSCPPTEPLQEEIDGELSLAECEELYGPDKEPVVTEFPDKASSKADILIGNQGPVETANSVPNTTMADNDSAGCAVTKSSGGENSPNPSLVNKNLRGKEKKNNKPDKDLIRSISKKVEAYIKEHIRPLCKSGVITAEQYRWAVERTTTKIMKYHSKDANANFLIKEGEKVKKLAEQYVEAAQKKDSS